MTDFLKPVEWKDNCLYVLNQLKLPEVEEYNPKTTVEEVFHAIRDMELRGAPLIGIAAAYGMVIAALHITREDHQQFMKEFKEHADYLGESRPTAVNLFWALKRMVAKADTLENLSLREKQQILLEEAKLVHQEDEAINRAIGENLISLLKEDMCLMTHCNAGSLATSKYGTATAPMYIAKEKGWNIKVFANETRPYLQGARLTAYELFRGGIDVTLITDNMAGFLMSQGKIDAIITGADRVVSNGDTANKIGTMSLAILAKYFDIPFYVAVPTPTIDLAMETGKEIPIEERGHEEVTSWFGKQIAPHNINVYNPAFDVTPNELITAIVTEKGIVYPPYKENLIKLFQ